MLVAKILVASKKLPTYLALPSQVLQLFDQYGAKESITNVWLASHRLAFFFFLRLSWLKLVGHKMA
jgi:hypothetical protein